MPISKLFGKVEFNTDDKVGPKVLAEELLRGALKGAIGNRLDRNNGFSYISASIEIGEAQNISPTIIFPATHADSMDIDYKGSKENKNLMDFREVLLSIAVYKAA